MRPEEINWTELKKDYNKWRSELYRLTKELLTCSNKVELSQYNEHGYYHKVRKKEFFEQMKQDWKNFKKVSQEWLAKGNFPGIWTAMFDPHNTYSIHSGSLCIVKFYFKNGYYIYDRMNSIHTNLLEIWEGVSEPNPWETIKNENGLSLKQRIEKGFFLSFPSHKKFFEDHKFGAVIGYSDYISPVIILEDSIKNVEFMVFK